MDDNSTFQINKLTVAMFEYQKTNNIVKQCVTNTQILYDFILANFPELEPKPVAVICYYSDPDNDTGIFLNHVVLQIKNVEILEPSYEVFIKPNVRYFKDINHCIKCFPDRNNHKHFIQELLTKHLGFINITSKMINGELMVVSLAYYHDIHNYINYIREH
jgi:hypothetical protein